MPENMSYVRPIPLMDYRAQRSYRKRSAVTPLLLWAAPPGAQVSKCKVSESASEGGYTGGCTTHPLVPIPIARWRTRWRRSSCCSRIEHTMRHLSARRHRVGIWRRPKRQLVGRHAGEDTMDAGGATGGGHGVSRRRQWRRIGWRWEGSTRWHRGVGGGRRQGRRRRAASVERTGRRCWTWRQLAGQSRWQRRREGWRREVWRPEEWRREVRRREVRRREGTHAGSGRKAQGGWQRLDPSRRRRRRRSRRRRCRHTRITVVW